MTEEVFQIVALGCTGGPRENNLSGYLLSPIDGHDWLALDAGSLLAGIDCALAKGSLQGVDFKDPQLKPAAEMLIHHIRSFLISHAHLDHILGMVINSQIDMAKTVLASDTTIDNLRDHIFNGKIWPNYGSEGAEPILNHYRYMRLGFGQENQIPETGMTVEAHLLSHPDGYPSTAFLIGYKGRYLLYFGDTSSDLLEREKRLLPIWQRIAPLIREKRLCGILLECSYPQRWPQLSVFGHLDTKLMLQELERLEQVVGSPLEGLKVLVVHRKESLRKGVEMKEVIRSELLAQNNLKLEFIFPVQGERYIF